MKVTAENRKRRYFSPADLLIAGLVAVFFVLFAGMLFMSRGDGELSAQIYVKGELYDTIELASAKEPQEIEIEGKIPLLISVSSEGAEFVHSGCPDKLCVRRGLISKDGQSAVCLPAGVSVKIVSDSDKPSVDAVAG